MISQFLRGQLLSKHLLYRQIAPFTKVKISEDGSDPDFSPQLKESDINDDNAQKVIDQWVKQNKVLLFMKGNPSMPMCGYSNFVIEILKFYKIRDYKSVDILSNQILRAQVKLYSNWPTFPQLYVGGKLIGGSDIINEMHKEGSLKQLFTEQEEK